MLLVIGQLDWLLELSEACLCWGFSLLNFSSCSVDAFPTTCISCHVCLWSRALPDRDCPLGNAHVTFVDISLQFYWSDLGLLSLSNSLSVSVVLSTS